MNLDTDLTRLEHAQLVRRAEDTELTYLFKHILVQETAYNSLLKHDRKQLHSQVGEALERVYLEDPAQGGADRAEELAPLLAQHFDQAGDDARALKYYTVAGDAAARVYANAEAIAHYTRALELIPKRGDDDDGAQLTHLYTGRGRLMELSGQYAEALQNYVEMETQAQQRRDRALELVSLIARATLYSTPTVLADETQGQALADRALLLAREIGDRAAEAKILWNLMLLYMQTGRGDKAVEYGQQSLALARELNLTEQLALTLNDLARAYLAAGDLDDASVAGQEAETLWRALGNLPMVAENLSNSAGRLFFVGDYAQAIARAEEAYRISQSIGNLWGQAFSRLFLGVAEMEVGDIAKAIGAMEESIRLSEPSGFLYPLVGSRGILAYIYGSLGDVTRGLELARLALDIAEKRFPTTRAEALFPFIILYLSAGDLTAAEKVLKESMDALGDAFGGSPVPYLVALSDAVIGMARRDYARVIRVTDRLMARLQQFGTRFLLADALYLKAEALAAQGQTAQAYELLQQGRRIAEETGARIRLFPILIALAELEAARGNAQEARKDRAMAREIVEYIAAHTPSEPRVSFLNLPLVHSLLARDD